MSDKDTLNNIKKLRELTGVGFKDCKAALDETKGNLEKSVEYLRKKGIAKASKKMSRTASEGLVLVNENEGNIALIEINSETDFVAKNKDFISFCKELSKLNYENKGDIKKLEDAKMSNGHNVNESLVSLIAKIGEKISIRRTNYFDNTKGTNFFYVHSAIEKNIGKIVSIVKLEGVVKGENDGIGQKIAMHIAASNPLAIDEKELSKETLDKELEIIKAEITNSGKQKEMVEKISKGKLNKFISDNTLLNQIWIMDPKKKVSDILQENKINQVIKILNFVRYKVGEGV